MESQVCLKKAPHSNSLGRLYGKYIYSTGDGYVYNRLSINLPEIIGVAVLVTYAPGVVGGASAAGASIQIFK